MLSIWDKVSVTAFRKRQIQHNQKLSALHAAGYHKGKEGRLSDTITPSKKRRVRQKFLASNRGGMGNNPVARKKLAR
jgi:ribosome modulation factor